MKIFLAGQCPLCSSQLAFEQDGEHFYYECTGKDHFNGIAPASWSLEKVLLFDLEITPGDICPTCGSELSKRETEKVIEYWCPSKEHLYARQEPKDTDAEHPFKGPEWYTWLGLNNLIPQAEYDERIKSGETNN